MQLRPTERIRCVKKEPAADVKAQTYEDFKRLVCAAYTGFKITFYKSKALIHPFSSGGRLKLRWVKHTTNEPIYFHATT